MGGSKDSIPEKARMALAQGDLPGRYCNEGDVSNRQNNGHRPVARE